MIMQWLAALMFSAAVSAEAPVDARAQLDAFAEGLDSLTGQFEQTTVDAQGRVTEVSSGEFFFARPDRFRWNYESPFPQEIVADGEQLWHYDVSLEQVTVSAQPAPDQSPLLVIMRPELLERFYRVSESDADSFEFLPRGDNAEIERGRLQFDSGAPAQLEVVDRFGQTTRLTLSGLDRNAELAQGLFEFELPEGVDLLEGY